ncbi:MAG: hypothetical protein GTO41_26315 [Burkholderiales bacterium]|nr:hypothetical protein [Burkholderiales bacterium]
MKNKDPKKTAQTKEPGKSEHKTFEEPELKFIEPKLTDHGDLTKLTHGFFGTFTP